MATHSSVLAWKIPGTGGAWWAAICGVAQSRTRQKWLSSNSMIFHCVYIALIVYPFNSWWTFGLFPHYLLWIVLLWAFIYKFLCGNIFFIFLGYISWSTFLVHIVILCLKFWGNTNFFFFWSGCITLQSNHQCKRIPISPHPDKHLSHQWFWL